MNNKIKGYLFAAISAVTYGMNPLFALPLYECGMDLYSVLFFRYLFAIPILAAMLKIRRRDFSIEKKDFLPLIILGILFALSSITLFSSYHHMDAGIASTILFVYPIIVALIMFFFFKRKDFSENHDMHRCRFIRNRAIMQEQRRRSNQHQRHPIRTRFLAVIRNLYRLRQQIKNQQNGDYQSDFIRLSHRLDYIRDTSLGEWSANNTASRKMVALGKHHRTICIPNRHFIDLHNRSHSIYRLDANCNIRCLRTSNGSLLRHRRLS